MHYWRACSHLGTAHIFKTSSELDSVGNHISPLGRMKTPSLNTWRLVFHSNWKNEATTTFHNKPGSQQPEITAKTDEIRLLKFGSGSQAAAKPGQKAALRPLLYIVELSATFLLHHLSSMLQPLCLVLILQPPPEHSVLTIMKPMQVTPPRVQQHCCCCFIARVFTAYTVPQQSSHSCISGKLCPSEGP